MGTKSDSKTWQSNNEVESDSDSNDTLIGADGEKTSKTKFKVCLLNCLNYLMAVFSICDFHLML